MIREGNVTELKDVMSKSNQQGMLTFDQALFGLYNAKKKIMISYDDPQSMRVKGHYVREHDLGGVMFWELTGDDPDHALLGALTKGLSGAEEE